MDRRNFLKAVPALPVIFVADGSQKKPPIVISGEVLSPEWLNGLVDYVESIKNRGIL